MIPKKIKAKYPLAAAFFMDIFSTQKWEILSGQLEKILRGETDPTDCEDEMKPLEAYLKPKTETIIYAIPDKQGMYKGMLQLDSTEITFEGDETNDDGTYYLEYVDEGLDRSTYFIEKLEL